MHFEFTWMPTLARLDDSEVPPVVARTGPTVSPCKINSTEGTTNSSAFTTFQVYIRKHVEPQRFDYTQNC